MSDGKRLILEGYHFSGDSLTLSRAAMYCGWDIFRTPHYTKFTYENDGVKPVVYANKYIAEIVSKACGVRFDRPGSRNYEELTVSSLSLS